MQPLSTLHIHNALPLDKEFMFMHLADAFIQSNLQMKI